jgi:ubiquinone/menaquinone biosynthesis C-methylase UbiE
MGLIRFLHRYLVRQTMPGVAADYYEHLIDSVQDIYLAPVCEEIAGAWPGTVCILDAGTGTGQLPVMLAQRQPQCAVTGVDLSEPCVVLARKRAAKAGVAERVSFVRGNLEAPPVAAASQDLVVSTLSLHHWRHPAQVLRALAGTLRPGGQMWIMDDAVEALPAARAAWIAEVSQRVRVNQVFRLVFSFESRHLEYSRAEIEALCHKADVRLLDFELRGAFFMARMARR